MSEHDKNKEKSLAELLLVEQQKNLGLCREIVGLNTEIKHLTARLEHYGKLMR